MTRWSKALLESSVAGGGSLPSLNGADLIDQDLSGLDLHHADLSYAHLEGADLTGADLRGAILFGAKAAGACLRQADLRGANLTAADFTRADLTRTRLEDTDLSGTNLSGTWGLPELDQLSGRGAVVQPDPTGEVRSPSSSMSGPVTLRVGQVLRIDVVNPSGGYRWTTVEPVEAPLDTAEPLRAPPPTDLQKGMPAPGAHRPVIMRYRARRPGTGTLRLVLARPWEHGKELQELVLDVHVLPSSAPKEL